MNTTRLFLGGILALATLLAAACGGNVETVGSGGHTTTTSTSSTSSISTSTISSTSSSSGGGECGGLTGIPCGADEYCHFEDGKCGGDDGPGTCQPRPNGCNDIYQPACGCDGKVYGNPCSAIDSGIDLDSLGGCQPPGGYFACGGLFCLISGEYCQEIESDGAGVAGTYSCLPLPSACGSAPSCACLPTACPGATCMATSDGGFQVDCVGQ